MNELVLVVDDEKDLVSTLEYNLRKAGYETRSAYDGAGAMAALEDDRLPDLVILDLMLPDQSGTEICRQLRSSARTRGIPVLMLTAKGEEIDRVVGFEVGADDYMVKPFSVRELMLRVAAIMRRVSTAETASSGGDEIQLFGLLRLDRGAHRAWVDDSEVTLTALEFKLLSTFLARKGRVQTRDALLSDVWGIDADVTTRTVDTHVKRLREKIGPAGIYIETSRGVGYRFREQPAEEP
ncbi:MAG TPA: response regulator transcription factor [Kofleriaceae bacterium]|nr:response regulator transcription factor [Kofleriaceae bacterium]